MYFYPALKKLAHILLSITILVSSLNFRIDAHFCGGELKSASLFGDAEPCSHANVSEHVPLCHSNSGKEDKNCCEDEQFVVDGLELDTPVNLFHIDLTPDWELDLFVVHHKSPIAEVALTADHYLNYKPPLLKPDIPVLFQSFLI